ncbi:MAG: thioredoxin domain-containing protein [Minisyncoccota bacterium]
MKKQITIVMAVLVVILAGAFFLRKDNGPGEYDTFATCLKDKGAIFFGAFWCPHCREQKAMFGNSAKLLPYTECSTPDGQGQTSVCKENDIKSYPTWQFANGDRSNGTLQLSELAEKTGCQLPVATE